MYLLLFLLQLLFMLLASIVDAKVAPTIDEAWNPRLSWLRDDQRDAVADARRHGNAAARAQILSFWRSSRGRAKEQAEEELAAGCRRFFNGAFDSTKAAELWRMQEEGESVRDIFTKVETWTSSVPEQGRERVVEGVEACRQVFEGGEQKRNRGRRGHHLKERQLARLRSFAKRSSSLFFA